MSTQPLQLHGFGESGHTYKVALALQLTRLEWTPVFVDFFNGETRTPAFRKLNVMGECPVLVDGDEVLTQSGSILEHLTAKTGQLGGQTPQDIQEIRRWTLWDNHKMSSQAGMLRFMKNFLPEDKREPKVIEWLSARMQAAFRVLEGHLTDRNWVVGQSVTTADISCASYLYYPEPFGFDRAAWPHIHRWLENLEALPNWAHPYTLMPRAFPPRSPAT